MSAQIYHFTYDFHPVGQGLFASGSIRQTDQEEPFFQWVYDCGTSSSQKLIDKAIDHLDHFKRLDLVTLSHFDHDHVSGICQLAGKVEIDTLMLPYMTLEQRLWMAFEENVRPNDDIMGFFLNPTEYFSGLQGVGIKNILYVPPSGNEGVPEQTGEPSDELDPNQNNSVPMQIDFDEMASSNDLEATSTNSQLKVQFLKPGGTLRT